jgi:DNA-3-methyladenine glycosylase
MPEEWNPKTRSVIRPLDRAFFFRDPRRVARELLGKILVRAVDDDGHDPPLTARIVEVEAYLGEKDPAAHAYSGCTPRNAVLFGPPGHAYIYFIYGNHYCLNVSCEPQGRAGSVLFRALEPLTGIEEMARARGIAITSPRDLPKLTSGPGRLAEAFGITRVRDNGCDLTSPTSSLWIGEQLGERNADRTRKSQTGRTPTGDRTKVDSYRLGTIRVTPRVGITKAAGKPLRYILEGNPFISGTKNIA